MLGDQSGEHVPLAAVIGRRLQQIGNRAVVEVAVCGLDNRLEEVIGTLELVPEHRVVLREFELFEPAVAHHADAQKVQPGEQPAAAALPLVRDLPVVQRRRRGVVDAADDLPVDGDVVNGHPGHGVLGQPVDRAGREILAQSFQITDSERSVHQSILSRHRLGPVSSLDADAELPCLRLDLRCPQPSRSAGCLLKITGLVVSVRRTGSRTRCATLRGDLARPRGAPGKGPDAGWPDLLPTAAPA